MQHRCRGPVITKFLLFCKHCFSYSIPATLMGVGKPQREYVMVLIFRACTVTEIMRSAAVAFSIDLFRTFFTEGCSPELYGHGFRNRTVWTQILTRSLVGWPLANCLRPIFYLKNRDGISLLASWRGSKEAVPPRSTELCLTRGKHSVNAILRRRHDGIPGRHTSHCRGMANKNQQTSD